MPDNERTYFLCPTTFNPPNGPVQLGNVLASVREPHIPLYSPDDAMIASLKPSESVLEDYKCSIQNKRDAWKVSIATKILSNLVGVGADVSLGTNQRNGRDIHFEKVEIREIDLPKDFIQHCLDAVNVREFIDASFIRKDVYIVTGIMVARGKKSSDNVEASSVDLSAGVAIDPTVWSGGSVPISVGPDVSRGLASEIETSWKGSTDFVYAYRLRRILMNKFGKAKVKGTKEWTKGAMLHADRGVDEEGDERPTWEAEQEDFIPRSEQFSIMEVADDFNEGLIRVVKEVI